MGLLQVTRHSRRDDFAGRVASCGGFQGHTPTGAEEVSGRHEPDAFAARVVPQDPYAVWCQQREAEREREERPAVRWVHSCPAIVPSQSSIRAAGAQEPRSRRESSGGLYTVHLVGA
jgi:hypothetical protein